MGHVVSMVMVKTPAWMGDAKVRYLDLLYKKNTWSAMTMFRALCGISPANIGKLYAASVLGDSSSFVLVIQPGNGIRNRNSAWWFRIGVGRWIFGEILGLDLGLAPLIETGSWKFRGKNRENSWTHDRKTSQILRCFFWQRHAKTENIRKTYIYILRPFKTNWCV